MVGPQGAGRADPARRVVRVGPQGAGAAEGVQHQGARGTARSAPTGGWSGSARKGLGVRTGPGGVVRVGPQGAGRADPAPAVERPDHTSITTVKGPSLVSDTFISAPNTPVATVAPSARNRATTSSTRGSATAPGAAAFHVGRLPLRASP